MSSLSVHLQSFPDLKNIVVDADVVAKMDLVRDICNSALSLRKDANIRVRMPISKMTLCSGSTDLDLARELSGEFLQMIKQVKMLRRRFIMKVKMKNMAAISLIS